MSSQRKRPARNSKPSKARSSGPAPAPLKPIDSPPEIESFHEWQGLGDELQAAIAEMGITVPTPIQALSIGPVLEGRDMIAKAETGTGKTLAFGAPMIAKVDPARHSVLGLVLSPTRELAEQVYKVLEALGEKRGLQCNLIVGGEPMQPQVKSLQAGAQIVVGTPGRVLDLMQQGFLSFPWVEFAVLDEADKMLEIGFIDDVKKILDACNEYRQTLLFSATFPPALLTMARGYTDNPLEVATASGVSTADTVHQTYLEVRGDDRAHELRDLIRSSGEKDIFLVFCDRRTEVDRLIRRLERERFAVKALHGGYDQASRFRVMDAFRTGEVKVLIATDVASRGLDVNHVTFVVNLNAPRDVSDYTHRIGRTGRAGREGTAVTFVGDIDRRRWSELERALPNKVQRLRDVRELFDGGQGDRKRQRDRDRDGDRNRDRGRGRDRDRDRDRPRGGRDRDRDRPRPSRDGERPRRNRSGDRPHRDREEERPNRERSRSREEERPRRDRDRDRDGERPRRAPRKSEDRGSRKSKPLQDRPSDAKRPSPPSKGPGRKAQGKGRQDNSPGGFGSGL